jgi:hypothetical protein
LIGILALNNSAILTESVTLTGCDVVGIGAISNSYVLADKSVVGLGGYSTSILQFSPFLLEKESFHVGDKIAQEQASNHIAYGIVQNWNYESGVLNIANIHGLGEAKPGFNTSTLITGVSGGFNPNSTFSFSEILVSSNSTSGIGIFASNNSTVSCKKSLSAFNRFANYCSNEASNMNAFNSVSCGSCHSGFLATQSSSLDASSSMSMFSRFGFRAENQSNLNANGSVALNCYKHSYHARNGSLLNSIAYEPRIGKGSIGQLEYHNFATQDSFIKNTKPTYVESSVHISGTTFEADLVAPVSSQKTSYSKVE